MVHWSWSLLHLNPWWLLVSWGVDRSLSWFLHFNLQMSMQNHRPLSFLCTSTMALPHRLWLGWIAPTSNISFMCAWTSSTIGGWILQNVSLKGSSSMTLISCFARSVQPNSPGSKEKMSWYSARRTLEATWFLTDHPSMPDNFSCWKSISLLYSTDILVCWIPWISSSFFNVPSATFTWSTAFTATTWATLTPLAMVVGVAVRFFTPTATCLLLVVILVWVFMKLKPWGKQSPSPPSRVSIITCVLLPKNMVFVWACMILDKKKLYFFFLYHFDSLVQVDQTHGLVHSHFTSNEKFCLMACQQVEHSWPIQGIWQLIDFTLFDHIYDLIYGQHAQSSQHSWSKGSWILYD